MSGLPSHDEGFSGIPFEDPGSEAGPQFGSEDFANLDSEKEDSAEDSDFSAIEETDFTEIGEPKRSQGASETHDGFSDIGPPTPTPRHARREGGSQPRRKRRKWVGAIVALLLLLGCGLGVQYHERIAELLGGGAEPRKPATPLVENGSSENEPTQDQVGRGSDTNSNGDELDNVIKPSSLPLAEKLRVEDFGAKNLDEQLEVLEDAWSCVPVADDEKRRSTIIRIDQLLKEKRDQSVEMELELLKGYLELFDGGGDQTTPAETPAVEPDKSASRLGTPAACCPSVAPRLVLLWAAIASASPTPTRLPAEVSSPKWDWDHLRRTAVETKHPMKRAYYYWVLAEELREAKRLEEAVECLDQADVAIMDYRQSNIQEDREAEQQRVVLLGKVRTSRRQIEQEWRVQQQESLLATMRQEMQLLREDGTVLKTSLNKANSRIATTEKGIESAEKAIESTRSDLSKKVETTEQKIDASRADALATAIRGILRSSKIPYVTKRLQAVLEQYTKLAEENDALVPRRDEAKNAVEQAKRIEGLLDSLDSLSQSQLETEYERLRQMEVQLPAWENDLLNLSLPDAGELASLVGQALDKEMDEGRLKDVKKLSGVEKIPKDPVGAKEVETRIAEALKNSPKPPSTLPGLSEIEGRLKSLEEIVKSTPQKSDEEAAHTDTPEELAQSDTLSPSQCRDCAAGCESTCGCICHDCGRQPSNTQIAQAMAQFDDRVETFKTNLEGHAIHEEHARAVLKQSLEQQIEDGQSAVKAQVDAMSSQVEDVNSRTDVVCNQVNAVSSQVGDVSKRVDGVSGQVTDVNSRVEGVSSQVNDVSKRVDGVNSQIDNIRKDVELALKELGTVVAEASKTPRPVPPDQVADLTTSISDQVYRKLNQWGYAPPTLPPTPTDPAVVNPAEGKRHFFDGQSLFFNREEGAVKAAVAQFARSVESDPSNPVYRYYLGLALYQDNQPVDGAKQVQIGAQLEKQQERSSEVANRLERVQFAPRQWLERIRRNVLASRG